MDGDEKWAAPGLSCSMAQGWLAFKSYDQPKFPEGSHSSWHSHLYPTPRWDISSALFPGIQHFWNHSSPSYVGAQTLPLLQNLVYLPLTQLQQEGSSFSCNSTVPKVVGRGWMRSPLFNLLISDILQNWFNKSCLLKWKPGRQKLFLLFRCLPENSAAKYFCAAPKASPETFHVSLYTSSSLSSSFYLHI